MSQELVAIGQRQLLSPDDIENLKKNKFLNFTSDQIEYCSRICSALQLSPFLNQIHFVKRGNVITAQVGIDGYRLSAQRAGGYAGSDDPVFEYDDQSEGRKFPSKATVTVYRMVDGVRCGFTASARWEEYYPGDAQGAMWKKMPHNQLGKCSEALALRKAFPAELGSLRLDDEMHRADAPLKAQTIQDKIQDGAAIEVESRPVTDPATEAPSCAQCSSKNVMESKYHVGSLYCKDCKKLSPLRAA